MKFIDFLMGEVVINNLKRKWMIANKPKGCLGVNEDFLDGNFSERTVYLMSLEKDEQGRFKSAKQIIVPFPSTLSLLFWSQKVKLTENFKKLMAKYKIKNKTIWKKKQ